STAEHNSVKNSFYRIASIPQAIGIIDGTHVPIIVPHENEPIYVNRKQFHSINCQVIADPNYKIQDIGAKWPGSTHDSFIWNNRSARRRLYEGDLGDSVILGKMINIIIVCHVLTQPLNI